MEAREAVTASKQGGSNDPLALIIKVPRVCISCLRRRWLSKHIRITMTPAVWPRVERCAQPIVTTGLNILVIGLQACATNISSITVGSYKVLSVKIKIPLAMVGGLSASCLRLCLKRKPCGGHLGGARHPRVDFPRRARSHQVLDWNRRGSVFHPGGRR